MRKRIIEFPLLNAVKLVPITGKTDVTVTTSGKVEVIDPVPSTKPRKPNIKLSETFHSDMTMSPGGRNITAKIILPSEMATKENFLLEVHALFDQMLLEEIERERNLG